jgi:two-component system chemotaxis sensor kinase CheA
MDDVQEIVSVQPGDVLTVTGKRHISVRKQLIAFLEIRDLFHWNDDVHQDRHLLAQESASGKFEVVIIRSAGRTISLRVDSFVGSQDIVIKSLTDNFVKIAGLSGASILGDGSVCLMLDCSAVTGMALDRLAVSNEKTFINDPGSSHEFHQ